MLTSSGQTYEKEYILKHIQVNGNTDPITREKLINGLLIFNKNIKENAEDWDKNKPKIL